MIGISKPFSIQKTAGMNLNNILTPSTGIIFSMHKDKPEFQLFHRQYDGQVRARNNNHSVEYANFHKVCETIEETIRCYGDVI